MEDTDAAPNDSPSSSPAHAAFHDDDLLHLSSLLSHFRSSIPPPPIPPTPPTPPTSPPPPPPTPSPTLSPTLSSSLLLSMKPLHRSMYLALESRRAHLAHLNHHHLDPLNIERASWQYEVDHAMREVQRQQQMAPLHPLPLISEEEFRRKGQPHPSTPEWGSDSVQL